MLRQYVPLATEVAGRAPRDAEETESTFIGNALIKARALVQELKAENHTNFCVLADDSGLCVDLLAGAPGIFSARYAGDHVDPALNVEKLLRELNQKSMKLEDRKGHYTCALALVASDGREWTSEGHCHGLIAFDSKGSSGFGYDPVFYVPEYKQTCAEMTYDLKNSFSHRRRAFEALGLQLRG